MLSLRSLLKSQIQLRTLRISSVNFSDKKEAPGGVTDVVDPTCDSSEANKDVTTAPKRKTFGVGKVRKIQYSVAWPSNLAGEVQTKDSPSVEKMDVSVKNKGVGVWDIGNEDKPYKGHSSSAPYQIPTKAPPIGMSRLDVWKSLNIKSIPQVMNKAPDPTPGIAGPVIDEIADIINGSQNFLKPREVIRENTDFRSITHDPPHLEECPQLWYEDPPEETTMGFPVIRPPNPMDRWREGIRIRKSTPEDYPFIQDFRNAYDILIVGGGLMGSMIAYMFTNRVETSSGVKVGIIEKDPSYRYGLSTSSACGLRMQHSLPETIEASLFGSDFFRNIVREISIPGGPDDDLDDLNVPNIKFQPHGHLTLASEDMMEDLKKNHDMQKVLGVQSAMLTVKQLNKKFPWLNTTNIAGAILGLESEGWTDNWNMLQALKLRNIHQGVDYIHGEAIFMKKHKLTGAPNNAPGLGRYEDGTKVPLGNPFEVHVLLPDTKMVYPVQFSQCIIAAGGESGNVGKMAGIGEGTGVLAVEIPVKRQRQYVYQVHSSSGPGLNLPITSDPSGLIIKRDGHCGDYLVGMLPDDTDIPENMWGDVDPSHWEEVVLPLLQSRVAGFEHPTLKGSYPVDYDYNYYDGSPIVGRHPVMINVMMACGFNGLGAQMAPAVARGIMELMYDQGYCTIDLSRYAFDRILTGAVIKEQFFTRN